MFLSFYGLNVVDNQWMNSDGVVERSTKFWNDRFYVEWLNLTDREINRYLRLYKRLYK